MSNPIKKRHINLLNAVVGAILFMVLPVFFQFWYNRLLPVDKVFEYTAIIPVQEVYEVGEFPRLISDAKFYRSVPFKWQDVLKCTGEDHPDTFAFFSSYPSESGEVKVTEDNSKEPSAGWLYQGAVPQDPARCYIDSTITAELEYGIKKRQNILSDPFSFDYVENI